MSARDASNVGDNAVIESYDEIMKDSGNGFHYSARSGQVNATGSAVLKGRGCEEARAGYGASRLNSVRHVASRENNQSDSFNNSPTPLNCTTALLLLQTDELLM